MMLLGWEGRATLQIIVYVKPGRGSIEVDERCLCVPHSHEIQHVLVTEREIEDAWLQFREGGLGVRPMQVAGKRCSQFIHSSNDCIVHWRVAVNAWIYYLSERWNRSGLHGDRSPVWRDNHAADGQCSRKYQGAQHFEFACSGGVCKRGSGGFSNSCTVPEGSVYIQLSGTMQVLYRIGLRDDVG